MKKQDFQELVHSRVVVLDGGTGTELMRRGMPASACPEQWVLQHPEVLQQLQREYAEAGSEIICTCTFGANRARLAHFGIAESVASMNRALTSLTREAAPDSLVFGDIGPSGTTLTPLGDVTIEDALEAKKQQVRGLLDGGVDGFIVETMMDIQEARISILAIRDLCDLPIMASVTLDHEGRCLTGGDLLVAVVTLQALGADAIGCNCSDGPADLITHIRDVKPYAKVPLLAKPNAGLPKGDGLDYDIGPEEFAAYVPEFVRRGTNLLGGCCGTGPEYIRCIREAADSLEPVLPPTEIPGAVTSARHSVRIARGQPLAIIGERINPTGKKKLQEELRRGDMEIVRRFASEQISHGADLLDVNISAPGVDKPEIMPEAIRTLTQLTSTPLCIDTTDAEVLEAALRMYPGRALVNSISAETPRIEENLAIAAKYGAMFIAMPMRDEGMPGSLEEQIEAVETIMQAASDYGYTPRDVVVDGMLLAVSSDGQAPARALDMIEWADRTLKANTVVGLSNVSFGLPGRQWVNAGFLAMAVARGLNMAIANPMNRLVMATRYTANLLNNRDDYGMEYIRFYRAVLHSHKVVEKEATADYDALYSEEVEAPDEDIHEETVEKTLSRRIGMTGESA